MKKKKGDLESCQWHLSQLTLFYVFSETVKDTNLLYLPLPAYELSKRKNKKVILTKKIMVHSNFFNVYILESVCTFINMTQKKVSYNSLNKCHIYIYIYSALKIYCLHWKYTIFNFKGLTKWFLRLLIISIRFSVQNLLPASWGYSQGNLLCNNLVCGTGRLYTPEWIVKYLKRSRYSRLSKKEKTQYF